MNSNNNINRNAENSDCLMSSLLFCDCSVNEEMINEFNDINYNDDILDDMSNIKKKKKPIFKNRVKWTKDEDKKLMQMIMIFGLKNWRYLAKNMEGRNPRQCRERWFYYLNPNLNHANWTKEEDEMIMKLRNEYGPKWMLISKYFPNRTDAMIKNRYNVLIRMKKEINVREIQISNKMSDIQKNENIFGNNNILDNSAKQNELINENDSQILEKNSIGLDLCFDNILDSFDDDFFRNENFFLDNEKTNIFS